MGTKLTFHWDTTLMIIKDHFKYKDMQNTTYKTLLIINKQYKGANKVKSFIIHHYVKINVDKWLK